MSPALSLSLALTLAGTSAPQKAPEPPLVIRDALVFTAPGAAPLEHSTVVLSGGKITALGPKAAIPPEARTLSCKGCVVTAGFWNSHVHFMEPRWNDAASQPADQLTRSVQDMLTRYGFTTVANLASDFRSSSALKRRIEAGEVLGPRIYNAFFMYPPDGVPFYVREILPPEIVKRLPQPRTPEEAAQMTRAAFDQGAELLKLFTGSWVARGKVKPMPEPIAKAAVAVAHEKHALAFAHPSNLEGMQVAIDSGVDVLAHAADDTRGVDAKVIQSVVDHHMSMSPTLKLFSGIPSEDMKPILEEVHQFKQDGGRLIFGTDVGYIPDSDTTDEFALLAKAGLSASDILAMLTTAPAELFGVGAQRGRIAPGMAADVTVLESDPRQDVKAFARVLYTIRDGRVIFDRSTAPAPQKPAAKP